MPKSSSSPTRCAAIIAAGALLVPSCASSPAGRPVAANAAAGASKRLSVSGIYPHLAAFNDDGGKVYGECGIGAVVPWAGSLWYLTYPPHERHGSKDKLYQVDAELNVTVRGESVGGTHAGRMIHRESKQLVIGPYFIDEQARVRAVDVKQALPGRITAVARHLTDPAGKVHVYDMEGPIWEVDVATLATNRLFAKPAPGWHGKGAWTGQGRLIISNNGEASNARDLAGLTWELPETKWTKGPEDAGVLAEYDGKEWKIVSRRQHTDITGPGDLTGERTADDPIWALGWDKRSVLLQVRDKGAWHTHRVLKGSYTYDPRHGYYTEWPRIRSIGGGRFLMNTHGTFFDFPAGFRAGRTAGLRPLSTHATYLGDFAEWRDQVVLGADDASVMQNPLAGKSQSNLRFVRRDQLETEFGPAMGWGGVWVRDVVAAGVASDPLLVSGYRWRTLHLVAHESAADVTFTIEVDGRGDGQFRPWHKVTVPAGGYVPFLLPADLAAPWIRLRTDRDATVTAYLHGASPRTPGPAPAGLAAATAKAGFSGGLLRPAPFSRDLQFLAKSVGPDGKAGPESYYEIDEAMRFRKVSAPDKVEALRAVAEIKVDHQIDAASVLVQGRDGKRWRLPKSPGRSDPAASAIGPSRGLREITSERFTAQYDGTFYEVPRGGGNVPDFARMKPLSSHRARIVDFASWRGLLVIAGVTAGAGSGDGHVFRSGDGPALWFGAVDDLYKLGAPVGEGGPWRDTDVQPATPSDPYLMAGYGEKTVSLSHAAPTPVTFTVQVDPLADGTWVTYRRITVPAGETVAHVFPVGFSAHWVRLQSDRAARATATFRYR